MDILIFKINQKNVICDQFNNTHVIFTFQALDCVS